MTPTQRLWLSRVRGWRSSGTTAAAYAAKHGFAPTTLTWWACRLKTELERSGGKPGAVAVARVLVAPAAAAAPVVVSVGSVTISVHRGFDAEVLRDVVAALGAMG